MLIASHTLRGFRQLLLGKSCGRGELFYVDLQVSKSLPTLLLLSKTLHICRLIFLCNAGLVLELSGLHSQGGFDAVSVDLLGGFAMRWMLYRQAVPRPLHYQQVTFNLILYTTHRT